MFRWFCLKCGHTVMKCPVCRERELFWLIEVKIGKILRRSTFQCQTCGTEFKYFDFKGWKK